MRVAPVVQLTSNPTTRMLLEERVPKSMVRLPRKRERGQRAHLSGTRSRSDTSLRDNNRHNRCDTCLQA